MTPEMRDEGIWWLWTYLAQETAVDSPPQAMRADVLWRERVQPWLKRVWPHEKDYQTGRLAERFALLTTTTSEAFPEAVEFVMPFLVKSDALLVADALHDGEHPDSHPEPALRLLDATLNRNVSWAVDKVDAILKRIGDAQVALRDDATFRTLVEWCRLHRI
jgi:hypothetical protein